MSLSRRAAAAVLSAAVLLPVVPAAVGSSPASAAARTSAMSAAPSTANTVAGRAELAAWTARDARAKATIAYVARLTAARTLAAYRAEPAGAGLRAAADHARRDAAAKATIAHLAGVRATKARRASLADRPKARASRSAPRAASAGTGTWDRLAQCESGGNWSINTGNGYYGGLQFSPSSWRAVGGKGLPHQASKAEQIKRGELLQARAGWRSWPACSRKLGLR